MLTKPVKRTFVPGQAEVPYRPAETVCVPSTPANPPRAPGGHWETQCTTVSYIVGWDYGPASWDNPGPFPRAIYFSGMECRSVWVPD